jgi:hypothetical protein
MVICDFTLSINTLYMAKQLWDAGKKDLVIAHLHGSIDSDFYYENMMYIIEGVFYNVDNHYNEDEDFELMAFSDPLITDYFVTAARYGKRNSIPDDKNPYIIAVKQEARRLFSFCHSLDWGFNWRGLRKADRTRFVIQSYPCTCSHYDSLAYALLMLNGWLAEKLKEMTNLTEVSIA